MKWFARVAAVALLLSFPAAATLSLAPQSVRITNNDGSVVAGVTANGLAIQQTTAANLNATVVGTLTHNNAAPTTNNIGALTAVASAAAPTYTTGDQVLLSTDLSGSLRITGSISATNPSVSATGSAPPASATYIGGSVTTAAPTYTTGQLSGLSLQTDGSLRVAVTAGGGSNASVGSTAAAIPTSATYVGFKDTGGNLNAGLLESTGAGNIRVSLYNGTTEAAVSANGLQIQQATAANLRIAGGDAAGSPTAGTVLAVQGIAGGTVLPVSLGAPAGMTTFRQATPITASGTIVCSASTTVSQPTEIYQINVASADYWRCNIQYNNNGTPVVYGYCITTPSSSTCVRTPPKSGWRQSAGATGTQQWEAACTLFGATTTPDLVCDAVYCTGSSC
jgi:hypothetical protein